MRFLEYRVENVKFGNSKKEREKAEKLAKEKGKKVELWVLKI